jgi:hypothetical protein
MKYPSEKICDGIPPDLGPSTIKTPPAPIPLAFKYSLEENPDVSIFTTCCGVVVVPPPLLVSLI